MQSKRQSTWQTAQRSGEAGPLHISRVMDEWFLHHQRMLDADCPLTSETPAPTAFPAPDAVFAACALAKLPLVGAV